MKTVAIDVETSAKPNHLPWLPLSFLCCVSTADDEGERRTWFFEHPVATKSPRQCIEEINEYLSKYDRVVAHNLKFDALWLRAYGILLDEHKLWCTMVIEYLIRRHGNLQQLSLGELAKHYGLPPKHDKVKVYWDAEVNTDAIPADILQVYCEQDALDAMLIFKRQTSQVNEMGLGKLLSLEMEVIRCYVDMEHNGMRVDLEACEQASVVTGEQLEKIDSRLKSVLGIDNPGSGHQLSAGLFGGTIKKETRKEIGKFVSGAKIGQPRYEVHVETLVIEGIGFNAQKLGVPMTAVDGVYSVSKETSLPLLKGRSPVQKEVLALMAERSVLDKLKSGYYDSIPKIQYEAMVRSSINQALTKTGRLSSSKPNLQNLPRGRSVVKQLFVTRF